MTVADYVGFLPGRSCIDTIRSIESTDLHRLFTEAAVFDLADYDPLIGTFSDYAWIVTFLGGVNSDFERNLIYTAHCSHSAEVLTLSLKPPDGSATHVAEQYVRQFVDNAGFSLNRAKVSRTDVLIRPTAADRVTGMQLLGQEGINLSRRLVLLHPGSGGRPKCWHLDNFVSVAKRLLAMGFEVLFLLGPAEMERFSVSEISRLRATASCAMNLPLSRVLAMLSCAHAFVGNDSGVTHLAGATGLPTIAMFGPTDPSQYAPIGPEVRVFRDPDEGFSHRAAPGLQRDVLEAVETWAKS